MLVSPELVAEAPADALVIPREDVSQAELNDLLVELGQTGIEVVRLKGGDPFIFGRGGEEAEALLAAGVPFEVVPGVSALSAVPASAGIPITHRGVSAQVTLVSGPLGLGRRPRLRAASRARRARSSSSWASRISTRSPAA